ncbi:hypothetical protein GXP67_05690 [Rhodocytophaga rosea]|uniref:Uncharacterized protein n=1 Tax=Rhodocytophaga rosea TaxID=2704465 RepID=A0A6C0GEE6_9BACT|nr:MmpS family transport accessory protein [Rhodocytophaga rosea]QHT66194.1 hypothetical protein GXP67_05690 [Rhodocytophaga rosea]
MKEKINMITRLSVLVLATLFLNECNKSDDPKPAYPKNVSVAYKVSGTGVSKVTSLSYTNATGGSTSLTDTTIPFSVSFNGTVNVGDDLGLSVLHNNSATGNPFNIKLEIYVDNKLVKTETYEGTSSVIGAIVHFF